MYLCDFHIHSHYSDGKLSIAEIVDLYGKSGFGAIAITDHLCESQTWLGKSARFLNKTLSKESYMNYISEIKVEADRAKRLYNMLVIPGVEITKNSFSHDQSAHIVALGVDRFIDPEQDILSIIDSIHSLSGLAVAAHPVSTRKMEPQTYQLWNRRDELSRKIDAWEVASGATLFDEVYHSGLPMLANSDMHRPQQINSWKTLISGRRESLNVLKAIKEQDLGFTYFSEKVAFETRKASPAFFIGDLSAQRV